MKKIIDQTSTSFYRKLNEKNSYTVGDLADLGFPDFLCESIRNTIQTKITQQMTLPSSEWSYTEAEQVQQTKQLLLDALYNEAHLSARQAEDVIRESISDIVSILIQPRQHIPETIFGENNTLPKKTIEEKVSKLTVYRHFARVLSSYLNRKERSSLTKAQCKNIIASVDETLSDSYSPSQWTQLLEPLFTLTNNRVDADLLCLFFEDKDMPDKTQVFRQMSEPVDRQTFTEILSSPEPAETTQTIPKEEPTDDKPDKKQVNFSPSSPVADHEADTQKPETSGQQREEDAPYKQPRETTVDTSSRAGDDENKAKSLNEVFASAEPEEKARYQAAQTKTARRTPKDKSADAGVPLWQRFSDDDDQTRSEKKTGNGNEPNETTESVNKNRKRQLKQQLSDNEQVYIDELFNGSKDEFEKNIAEIAAADQWDDAANTIKKDIFEKHNVNIYSPVAVNFTDQLQQFFNKNI